MKTEICPAAELNSVAMSLATVPEITPDDSQFIPSEPTPFPSAHLASLLLNSFLWILTGVFLVVVVWTRVRHPERPLDHSLGVFCICWFLLYLFYLVEAFTSSTFRMLAHKRRLSRVAEFYQRLCDAEPQINFVGTSFHYPGQNHHVHHKRPLRFFRNRKILTHTAVGTFYFDSTADSSDPFPDGCSQFHLIKFTLDEDITLADRRTEDAYAKTLEEFNQQNEPRDFHYSLRESKRIPGFCRSLYAVRDSAAGSFYSPFMFVFFTVFLLSSWPYRVWIQRRFGRVSLSLRKAVSVRGR